MHEFEGDNFPLCVVKKESEQKKLDVLEENSDIYKEFLRLLHGSYETKKKIIEIWQARYPEKKSIFTKYFLDKKINDISKKERNKSLLDENAKEEETLKNICESKNFNSQQKQQQK